MTKQNKKNWISPAVAATVAALSQQALANVSVQQYYPAANATYTMTEDALLDVAPKEPLWTGSRLFFSANYNWINDALIQYNAARTQREATLVDGIQTLDLGLGWFLDRRFSINFATAMNVVHIPSEANRFAFGDSRLFGKWRLTDDQAWLAVSLIPELRIPTGNSTYFLSDGSMGYGGLLAVERDFGPVRAAINVGYRYSPTAQFQEIDYTHRVPMSLGMFVPLTEKFGVVGEANGSLVLPTNSFNNPGEFYGGGRYQFNRDCTGFAGVSLGGVNREAGNDVRVSVGIRFSPMPEPRVVEAPKVIPAPLQVAVVKPAPAPKPRVVFTPKEIQLGEEIKFKHDSAILTRDGKRLLDEVAFVMKNNKKSYKKILIEGHTNELGSYPHNQVLSENRAKSVRSYLVSKGLKGKDFMVIGYGKTKPKGRRVMIGLSKDAKLAVNRRVEFKVIN